MRKRLLMVLSLLLVLIPFSANGMSITLGAPTNGNTAGVVYIPIELTLYDNEPVNSTDTLSCLKDSDLVKCEIEAVGSNTYAKDAKKIVPNGSYFQEGQIGRLVLTNSSYSDVVTKVTLDIGNHGGPTAYDVLIKALDKPKSNNSRLSELKTEVGALSPSFTSDVNEYTLFGISDSNRRFKFYYKCDNCSVKISGGVSTSKSSQDGYNGAWYVELNQGENPISIEVTSEDGSSTFTYKVNAIRGDTGYGSSKLKSLTIGEYTLDPEFSKDTLEYKATIPKKLNNITKLLKYELEDSKASVKVTGADALDNDENEVTIEITSRTNETSKYVLKITKEDVEALIEVIGYKDGKVTFIDTEGKSQTLPEAEFKAQYEKEWAKIDDGTYKFDEDGNIIKDTSSNDNTTTGKEEKKNKFPWIIVILIVLGIAIIGVSGYFIFRDPTKKKGKKNKNKDDEEEISEDAKEELEDIDSYNEEARLIAEENVRKDDKADKEEQDEIEETEELIEEVKEEPEVEEETDEEKSPTMDIDEALSDLMNTKEYNFKDK